MRLILALAAFAAVTAAGAIALFTKAATWIEEVTDHMDFDFGEDD